MKIYGRESVYDDFPCGKLENAKKKNSPHWKNPELILIDMCRPTYMPNLVTLSWKMSSRMSKEAGSANGPLCTYLMRQNLRDWARPRSWGNKCPCQVWKWSVKNYGCQSINGACLPCRQNARPPVRPPTRPPDWATTIPRALKGCGVKIRCLYFHHHCRYLNQSWSAPRHDTVILVGQLQEK